MYNIGDKIKFKKVDGTYLGADYDYHRGADLCRELGFVIGQHCTIKENKGIVVHPTVDSTHTLVEYTDTKGFTGVLYFNNIDLELAEKEVINDYPIY